MTVEAINSRFWRISASTEKSSFQFFHWRENVRKTATDSSEDGALVKHRCDDQNYEYRCVCWREESIANVKECFLNTFKLSHAVCGSMWGSKKNPKSMYCCVYQKYCVVILIILKVQCAFETGYLWILWSW